MICLSWPVFDKLITSELVSPSKNPFYLFSVKCVILPVNTIHQKMTSKQEEKKMNKHIIMWPRNQFAFFKLVIVKYCIWRRRKKINFLKGKLFQINSNIESIASYFRICFKMCEFIIKKWKEKMIINMKTKMRVRACQ